MQTESQVHPFGNEGKIMLRELMGGLSESTYGIHTVCLRFPYTYFYSSFYLEH